jgi:ubiquitin C-terminal hydrolase
MISNTQRNGKLNAFVGLNNLSNTCYMNSIFQQLFMIPNFRSMVLNVKNHKNNDVLYQSKLMISALLKLDKQSFTPQRFFDSLTDSNGAKFNPLEQRDADEFLQRYLDLLEQGMSGTEEGRHTKNLFEGKFWNQLIWVDCPHRSERDESFVTLSLQVKNKRNIDESLSNLVEIEMLQGENAYNCTQWEKKVTCIKR